MAYEYEKRIRSSVELELFRDGRHFLEYDAEVIKELKEVYAKAKAFDEIVPFIRGQYLRANQNYGFAKYYGKSNEELEQAEEQLFEKQQVAITVCNALDITLEEFIMLEDK